MGLAGCSQNQSANDVVVDSPADDLESPSEPTLLMEPQVKIQQEETDARQSAAAEPKSVAPKSSTAANVVRDISFNDLNLQMQEDVVFRPWMMKEEVKELEGQRIRIQGYMLPHERLKGIKQFVLLKNKECKFGPGGQADHLINVLMNNGVETSYRQDVIEVEGVLKINPFQGVDGNTWSIYDLAAEQVRNRKRR